jgi:nitrite reductase/ring-hydroxylating ferredoxin subunit
MAEFVRVANKSDVAPGCGIPVEVNGRQVALFNVNGEYYAIDNTCIHRGGPLAEGFIDSANLTVQCPWHGWIYSLASGESPIVTGAKVQRYELRVEGEEIQVAVE